jgi:transcriptional regulator with GAF, ATPase, and Fis domain
MASPPTSQPRPTITSPEAEGDPGTVRVQRVVVVYAPAPPVRSALVLGADPVVVGREPGDGGLALPDEEVSRQHVRLERDEDGWQLVDLGSRNGVHVDGVRVERAALGHGAVVRLGRCILVVTDALLRADQPLGPETAGLRGGSLALARVRGEVALVAPRPVAVLIHGETGVGKERVAEELHRLSGRRGGLISVNCAAISPGLAESELFGHVGGAFTGARGPSAGLFAAADGGTLFLDEIGELPLALQPKLLRALAVGEVRPVGASESRRVDVRVVAATHRDLAAAARDGGFREDLHARLSGWTVTVPPLRERRDDVLDLAALFLAAAAGRPVPLAPSAAEALLLHAWPYNVRELEQAMAVAAARAAAGTAIRLEHLPPAIAAPLLERAPRASRPSAAPPIEILVPQDAVPSAADLRRVLEHFAGSVARVAEYFGKDRKQIYRWLERAGIDAAAHRPSSDEEPA